MYEGKSFAQLSAEAKNQVSHRANALKALTEKLREQKGRQQI
jgi:inosine/xanthosine triphosphate pyrophosphatase family protein